jgi:hypothetical protein
MPNTIKQAVEFICEQVARRYAPKIWLNIPFTLSHEMENDEFTLVEVMLGGEIRKVIWDPKAPSPRTTSTCILVSDGFGNIVATTFNINPVKTPEESVESEEKQK